MRCIYCKADTSDCKSREHIIPESLGNPEFTLPQGWVCGSCNNYFGVKIEGPFMNSLFGRQCRAEMGIGNKRGRVPPRKGVHLRSQTSIELSLSKSGNMFWAENEDESEKLFKSIRDHRQGSFWFLEAGIPELNYMTARMSCKTAVNIFASKFAEENSGNEQVVDCEQLDEIRRYVRRGRPDFVWPVQIRRLHRPEEKIVFEDRDEGYESINEFATLFLRDEDSAEQGEICSIFAILGVEFVVNVGGPSLDRFSEWQINNNGESYLTHCSVSKVQDI